MINEENHVERIKELENEIKTLKQDIRTHIEIGNRNCERIYNLTVENCKLKEKLKEIEDIQGRKSQYTTDKDILAEIAGLRHERDQAFRDYEDICEDYDELQDKYNILAEKVNEQESMIIDSIYDLKKKCVQEIEEMDEKELKNGFIRILKIALGIENQNLKQRIDLGETNDLPTNQQPAWRELSETQRNSHSNNIQ